MSGLEIQPEKLTAPPIGGDSSGLSGNFSTGDAGKNFPPQINELVAKEHAAEVGHGPPMSDKDQATLGGWRQYPDNEHLRNLATKENMTMSGGPQLTPAEGADLISHRQFPDDPKYRDLAAKQYMADHGGPKMDPKEYADLIGKIRFPNDKHMHDLATKDILNMENGGPPLTKAEETLLAHRSAEENQKRYGSENDRNVSRADDQDGPAPHRVGDGVDDPAAKKTPTNDAPPPTPQIPDNDGPPNLKVFDQPLPSPYERK